MGKLDSNIEKGSGTRTNSKLKSSKLKRCCDNQHHRNLVLEGAMTGGTKIGGVHNSWDLHHQWEARTSKGKWNLNKLQTQIFCDNQHHVNLVLEGAMPGGTKVGGVYNSWDLCHQREART
jgi:hypothetical protein